jgi:hydrogenase maturation factor
MQLKSIENEKRISHTHWKDLIIMQLRSTSKKISSLALMSLGVFFMLLLAACGGTTGDNSNVNVNLSVNNTPQPTLTVLKHSPVGTTALSWDPESHKLTVNIHVTGLAPSSSHAAHIHAGNCSVDGAIVYSLNPVVADAKGDANSQTVISNVQNGIPASGWYINVHNGVNMTAIEHMPIACANISHPATLSKNEVQNIQVALGGSIAPNESASGTATLSIVNSKPAVTIKLSGLQPNSTHIAHIHYGSCDAQGDIAVMLNPVVADAHGNGTSVTTINSLPSSSKGLYVNVHLGSAMSQLSQSVYFDPIACGNMAIS